MSRLGSPPNDNIDRPLSRRGSNIKTDQNQLEMQEGVSSSASSSQSSTGIVNNTNANTNINTDDPSSSSIIYENDEDRQRLLDDNDNNTIEDEELLKYDEMKRKKQDWIVNAAVSSIFILMWYLFSVTISVYNKWMFSADKLNFPYPVIATSGHQIVQSLLAYGAITIHKRRLKKSQPELIEENESPWDWKEYFKTFGVCATASAGDIGMGNASMRLVTLTFYTMVKSSNLGFVLLFGILFRLERPTLKLSGIIAVMTIGVMLMVAGETQFELLGFILVTSAAACSGLRWSLTQILMKRENATISTHNNPLKTILYLSPIMAVLLFIIGMLLEGPKNIAGADLWEEKGVIGGLIILTIPGIIAFCMTLSEFLLLNRTSVLTLSIAGIFKELVTLLVAAIAFGDRLTFINSIGLVVTLAAIISYNWYRYKMAVTV